MNRDKKEMFCYLTIFVILLIIVVLNNVFWKLGKNTENITNNTEYLESNNVTYNVPYEERVLD
jgi:flagellar biogenesis protein FliO